VSPDEQEAILLYFEKDGYVKYAEVLRAVRGSMSPARETVVTQLFSSLVDGKKGVVPAEYLKQIDIQSHPQVAVHKVSPYDAKQDWDLSVDFWAPEDRCFTEDDWRNFLHFVSSTIERDDEFRMLVQSIG
jgi:uncharacterized protein YaiL (DUF2058 family)